MHRELSTNQRYRIALATLLLLSIATPSIFAAEVVLDFLAADANIDGRDVASAFGDPQDFFPIASVNGNPGALRDIMSNNDHPQWYAHQIRATVDPAFRFFTVKVRLDEADDFSDETFDIHPASSKTTYKFTFDACTMTYADDQLTPFLTSQLQGAEWLPYGNGDIGGNPDKDARVKLRISTGDGKPFTQDDLAIVDASPVQAPYDPKYIIEDKPTAFKVRIENTFVDKTIQAVVSVTLDDGIAPRTEMETFNVPPEGLTAFLFEDAPYLPKKNLANPQLLYSVTMSVEDEAHDPDACESQNNDLFGKTLPVVITQDKITVYRPFDAPPGGEPADIISPVELDTLFTNAEPYRKAIYPLATLTSSVNPMPIVASSGFPFDNVGAQLMRLSIAASSAGIEKMVLVPRKNSLLNIGLTSAGVSLGLFAPRAVFVEHDTFTTASHEIAHTFNLSRRNCTNGGLLEEWFRQGCLDEYDHPNPPRPYMARGFDVEGNIHPTGFGGVTGTRDVFTFNLMDSRTDPYGRWIDSYTYDLLTEHYRVQGDPQLIGLWGWVEMPGGLQDPPGSFLGNLFFSYRFDGIPDMPEAKVGEQSGAGRFELRIETQSGRHTYRFNPTYAMDDTADTTERGFFAVAVHWPSAEVVNSVELWGPADISDPSAPADMFLTSFTRSALEPDVSSVRAGLDTSPTFAGPQPEPPTIGPLHEVVIAWDATDADSSNLRTALHLKSPFVPGAYNDWLPMAIELENNSFTIPHEWLQGGPGLYEGQVLVSDGINTKSFAQSNLFTICNFANSGVEICDGLDDDCDGTIDNATAPGAGIDIGLTKFEITWPQFAAAESYDVTQGDLNGLRGTAGDFTQSVIGCLADDLNDTTIPFPDSPTPGEGFWVLVRGNNCAGAGTYETAGSGQVGLRDPELANTQGACP